MTTYDTPRRILVKTSTGWADLVVQGPPGPNGPTGPTGPTGPPGPTGPATPLPDRLAAAPAVIADADLALENGWYTLTPGAGHSPDAATYHLLYEQNIYGNQHRQIAYAYADDRVFMRRSTGGSWSAWALFADPSVLQTRAEKGVPNGYASLDSNGQLTPGHLRPSLRELVVYAVPTDANSAETTGWYLLLNNAANVPRVTDFYLEVIAHGADHCVQFAHELYAETSYRRTQAGGTWGPWIKIWPVAAGTPGYGTTLPASPTDGQETILVDSLTAPSYAWRLRYSTAIADAFKWVCIGGDAKTVRVETDYPTNAALGISVPRPGVYNLDHGGSYYDPIVDTIYSASLTADVGGSSLAYWNFRGVGSMAGFMGAGSGHAANVRVDATVTQASNVASGARLERRWIRAMPVRIS